MRTKTKAVLGSALAIALSASMIAGGTFALFTSESSVNIAVTSAKVNVEASIGTPVLYSPKSITAEGIVDADHNPDSGLSATVEGTKLAIDNMAPGDKVTVPLSIVNKSTIAVKYRVSVAAEEAELFNELRFAVEGGMLNAWEELAVGANVEGYDISVELPCSASGSELMGKTANIAFKVEAVQGNAVTGNSFAVKTEEEFEEAVAAARTSLAETEIVLKNDIALSQEIYLNGATANVVIDGNGHTVTADEDFHVRAEGGQYNLLKIFRTNQKVTVKNLTLKHGVLEQTAGTYHTLDIHTAGNVVLENVALVRDFTAAKAGAPLVMSGSNVTVKGELKLVAGGNAWYGVNVDSSTLTIAEAANVSYLDVNDLYDTRAALLTEGSGKVVNQSANVTLKETDLQDGRFAYQVVVAEVGGVQYANLHEAVKQGGTVTLLHEVELNTGLILGVGENRALLNGMVFDGNGYTLSSSEYFNANTNTLFSGRSHLVELTGLAGEVVTGITLKNVTVKLGQINRIGSVELKSNHTLNIWQCDNAVLENVTLERNASIGAGGTPLLVNGNNLTVKGELNLVAGGNSWYGANVSNAQVTFENAAVTYLDLEGAYTVRAAITVDGTGALVNAELVDGLHTQTFTAQGVEYEAWVANQPKA